EIQIISFITQGCMNRDIANSLSITEEAVKRRLTNIFNKVATTNRLELALFAIEHGLVRNWVCRRGPTAWRPPSADPSFRIVAGGPYSPDELRIGRFVPLWR